MGVGEDGVDVVITHFERCCRGDAVTRRLVYLRTPYRGQLNAGEDRMMGSVKDGLCNVKVLKYEIRNSTIEG